MASVTRDEAVLNTRLWAMERNWSLRQCADAMGINVNNLKTWMRQAGLTYTVKAACWMPSDTPADKSDMS